MLLTTRLKFVPNLGTSCSSWPGRDGGGGGEKGDHVFFRGNGWDQSSLAEY